MFLKTSKGELFDVDGLAAVVSNFDARYADTTLVYKAGATVQLDARRQDVVALIEAHEAAQAAVRTSSLGHLRWAPQSVAWTPDDAEPDEAAEPMEAPGWDAEDNDGHGCPEPQPDDTTQPSQGD